MRLLNALLLLTAAGCSSTPTQITVDDLQKRFTLTGASVQSPGFGDWFLTIREDDLVQFTQMTRGTDTRVSARYHEPGADGPFEDVDLANNSQLFTLMQKRSKGAPDARTKMILNSVTRSSLAGQPAVRHTIVADREVPTAKGAYTVRVDVRIFAVLHPKTKRPMVFEVVRRRPLDVSADDITLLARRFFDSVRIETIE